MKLILIQEAGRHEANRHFRECECLARAFRRLGHEPTIWGLGHTGFSVLPDWYGYDAIISLEDYDEAGWFPTISRLTVPRLAWIRDSHCGLDRYQGFAARHRFDAIMVAVKPHVEAFAPFAPTVAWLPNAFDDSLVYPILGVERTVPLGFVGNVNASQARRDLIEHLRQRYRIQVDHWVLGYDMVRALSSYRIAWNMCIGTDINCRTFEATAAGACLVTTETPGLAELYDKVNEIVIYHDLDELHAMLDCLLREPKRVAEIAEAGRQRALANHTYMHRAQTMLNEIATIKGGRS